MAHKCEESIRIKNINLIKTLPRENRKKIHGKSKKCTESFQWMLIFNLTR